MFVRGHIACDPVACDPGGICGRWLTYAGFGRRHPGGIARELLGRKRFALHNIAIAGSSDTAMAVATAPSGAIIGFRVCGALVVLLLRDQSLPVSDRDLIVVGMDFRERQKTMAIATVIDKRRLQGRLNTCDFGEVDITAELFAVGAFEVE